MSHTRLAAAAALGLALLTAASLRAQSVEQERLPPAVEDFRKALLQERNFFGDNVEGLRFRRETLEKRVKNLRSLVELSRALLLLEWGIDSINLKVAQLDSEIRDQVAQRFKESMERVVEKGGDDQKMAAAYLLGESAVNARKQSAVEIITADLGSKDADTRRQARRNKARYLKDKLSALAPAMVELTRNANPEVRKAAAAALGLIEPDPNVSVPALEAMLASKNVSERRAAAAALRQLIEVAADEQRKSLGLEGELVREPGDKYPRVAVDRGQLRGDPVRTGLRVVPAAARGARDPDVEVRRQSVEAWQLTSLALADLIPGPPLANTYPPAERFLDPRDKDDRRVIDRINADREAAAIWRPELRPLLLELRDQAALLGKAVEDEDVLVRRSAQRTLENLANLKARLIRFENDVQPPRIRGEKDDKDKDKGDKDKNDKDKDKDKNDKDKDKSDKDKDKQARRPARGEGEIRLVSWVDDKEDKPKDPITEGLQKTLPAVVKGLSDPDLQARLAAVGMLESMGTDAAETIPELIRLGLRDRSVFVRWASARSLGRMAPRQPERVVPALAALLTEQDLDLRLAVASALQRYGKEAKAAVPALAGMINRGDAESRVAMLETLTAVGPDAGPALPQASRALEDSDPRVRTAAADMIGKFGPDAVKFVGDVSARLRRALRDSDGDVRVAASEALLRLGEK